MSDLLDFLRTGELGILALVAIPAALLWMRLFPNLRLKDAAPRGIVSFELAWTSTRARRIIDGWQKDHRDGAARRSLWAIDAPFIVLYSIALSVLGVLAARTAYHSGLLSGSTADDLATGLAAASWGAGAADLIENVGLWLQFRFRPRQPLPAATSTVSTAKWLTALAVGVCSLGFLVASAPTSAAATAPPTADHCGKERSEVKTLTDPAASSVALDHPSSFVQLGRRQVKPTVEALPPTEGSKGMVCC